jgi:hypothetical protein
MGLIETLVLGGYLYTTAAFVWLERKIATLHSNHIKHIHERLDELERHQHDGDARREQGMP